MSNSECDYCGAGFNEDSPVACWGESGFYCCSDCRREDERDAAISRAENMAEAYG